jgi:uncharacterized protein (UPF0335 family)
LHLNYHASYLYPPRLHNTSSSHATAQTGDENAGELREQLNAAVRRIEELEKELLKVYQQVLDHLSDSR